MDKSIFVLKSSGERRRFASHILSEVALELLKLEPERLKIGITIDPNLRLTVLPLKPDNLAMISAWGIIDIQSWMRCLKNSTAALSGYSVEESVPIAYRKDWPDGQLSPGIILLTLMKQNPKLKYADFIHEWHAIHTPKAMRIHPMWSYIRNVITAPLVPGSQTFEGIVEEHYRFDRDVLNPVRMFGGPLKFLPYMLEVGRHVNHFLDLRCCENYLLREYHLKS